MIHQQIQQQVQAKLLSICVDSAVEINRTIAQVTEEETWSDAHAYIHVSMHECSCMRYQSKRNNREKRVTSEAMIQIRVCVHVSTCVYVHNIGASICVCMRVLVVHLILAHYKLKQTYRDCS